MVTMDKAHPPWKGKVEDDVRFQDFQNFTVVFLETWK